MSGRDGRVGSGRLPCLLQPGGSGFHSSDLHGRTPVTALEGAKLRTTTHDYQDGSDPNKGQQGRDAWRRPTGIQGGFRASVVGRAFIAIVGKTGRVQGAFMRVVADDDIQPAGGVVAPQRLGRVG